MSVELTAAWQLLGVGPEPSRAEVTRAYRQRARATHPDVSGAGDAAARFGELTSAYHHALSHLDSPPPAPAEHPDVSVAPVRDPYLRAVPGWDPRGWVMVVGPVRITPPGGGSLREEGRPWT